MGLDEALRRLERSLGLIEAAVARRLEGERRRGDLEAELGFVRDDRARLAAHLDGALARLRRHEAISADVGRRVERAVETIQAVLAEVEPAAGDEDNPCRK